MATTYQSADETVTLLLTQVLRDWHRELLEADVRVGVIMAYNPDGPAVRHGGYGAAATVRVVSAKDRVPKGYDAEILIDQLIWDELRPRQRLALLFHELNHLQRVPNSPKKIAAGELPWQLDDRGRPKLRLRKGDWNPGDGFRDAVMIFGDDAIEFDNLRRAWAAAEASKRPA